VREPPACEDVSPGAEELPLLEDVTKQRNEARSLEHWSFCLKYSHELYECTINPITNPNPVYSHSQCDMTRWTGPLQFSDPEPT
jgi:hypothetical protein